MNTNALPEAGSPLVVALTGGIASGKTAVSDFLATLGVPVVDTDLIARQVVEPGQPGLAAIQAHFGPGLADSDGQLDRKALARQVFSDPAARQQLEALLHPLIEAEARRQITVYAGADYVLLVVPLLVESGLFGDVDQVVVVDVPESIQQDRLARRDGLQPAETAARLQAQASRAERLARADVVLDNSGSLEALHQAALELHQRLVSLGRARKTS